MRQEKILQTYSDSQKIKESIKGGDGNQILKSWTYFANGKLKSETLGSLDTQKGGATTGYEYDQWNRLIKVKYSDGQSEEYECNKNDQVIKIKYADGSVKINEYNKTGFLTKETDEEGNVTEHGYNIWGEEVKRTDKNTGGSGDQFWEIKYNYFGQAKEEKRNNGQVWSYKYNKRGLLKEKVDPKGIKTTNTFDNCGRVTTESRSLGSKNEIRTFEYDSLGFIKKGVDGSVTSVMNGSGSDYKSNAYNLITKYEMNIGGKSLTTKYDYDKGQRISKVVYPDSSSVTFGYNGIGLLKEIGSETNTIAYANNGKYDQIGNLKDLTAGNTTKLTQTIDEAKNLLTAYAWGISGKSENTLTWNIRGNITAQTKNGISYTYEYDKKNQLTREKWEGEDKKNTWTYDGKGNRLTESKNEKSERSITCYQYSDLIKEDGIWKYNYDLNGNLITKGNTATGAINDGTFEGWTFNESDGEVWKYTYDLFNRLVNVEHSESGTKSLSRVAEYKYDYRDLMIYRKSGSVCEYFAYDNDGKLLYKETGSEKHYYIYANSKLWCEIVEKENTKKTYYHHTDHLGTTVCITDSTGKVIWNCEADAFGNVLSKKDSSFTPNFTGKFIDENTGLYYFNARWYDPEMGRFITEDPARDGRNWFVYCENNPLVYTDPDGRETTDKNKAAIYPTVGNAFNLDFGRDYSNMAVQNFKNGHPILGTIQMLDSACEIVYDLAAAYGCANVIGAFIATPTALLEKSESWLQSNGKPNYPPNNGAVLGTEVNQTLEVGTKIGRYGEIGPNSSFVTDTVSTASELSLPPWTDPSTYQEFTVIKPIVNVVGAEVEAWAGSTGGGMQYVLPQTIIQLQQEGYIK